MATPSAALNVRPPADPLQQYGRLVSLKSLLQQQQLQQGQQQLQQQQIQAATTQNQMQQMQLQSQKAFMQAFAKPVNWSDPNAVQKVMDEAAQNGATPQSILAFNNALLDQKTKLASLNGDELKNQAAQNDQIRGTLMSIIGQPNLAAKQQAWTQAVRQYESAGLIQPGQVSEAYPGDAIAQVLANHFALGSELAKEAAANKMAEARAMEAKTGSDRLAAELPGIQANNTIAQQKANLGIAGTAAAQASGAARGKLPYVGPIAQAEAAGNLRGEMGALKGPALDMAAENYFQTGHMPSGLRSPGIVSKIVSRAAQLHPGASLAQNTAQYQANAQSLTSLQRNFDQVDAFEKTAENNLRLLTDQAKKIEHWWSSPVLNSPWRAAALGLGGTDQAAFNAARQTAINEISRVLNSANGSGAISDSARNEINGLIRPNSSYKQVMKAADILKQEMENRRLAYQTQIDDIKRRIGQAEAPNRSNGNSAPMKITLPSGKIVMIE